jgi:hypothetical protein
LLGLGFRHEERSSGFLRIVCELVPEYMPSEKTVFFKTINVFSFSKYNITLCALIHREYREVLAKLLTKIPLFTLSRNHETCPCPKFNSYGHKCRRSIEESELLTYCCAYAATIIDGVLD